MDQAKTLCFAQSELERYLSQAGWKPGSYQYSVGLLEQTNEETDTLEIRTSGTFGSICGSNARTALTAVYRFLHEYEMCIRDSSVPDERYYPCQPGAGCSIAD